MEHRNITGLDALHPAHIRQAVDPGAIGADKGWLDTSVTPPRLRVRNATNTGWDDPAAQPGARFHAASAAARNAAFPTPQVNQEVARDDTGMIDRWDGGAWRPEGITRAAGPVIATVGAPGFVGDGVNDDGAALAAADALAVASGGRQELDLSVVPTRVHVNSNRTINGHFRPNPGAKRIYVAAGKTLTIAGAFDPGLYQIFDPTMPGAVVFTSRQIRRHQIQWWVDGTGGVNDSAAFAKLLSCIPNRATVEVPHQLKMRWDALVTWRNGFSVHFYSDLMPYDATGDDPDMGPRITWNGAAGAGTKMLIMDGCGYCEFFGINFQATAVWGAAGGADMCIDLQQTTGLGRTRITTQCKWFQCAFWGGAKNDNWIGVNSSTPATDNNEYHFFVQCSFRGTDQSQYSLGYLVGNRVSVAAGSKIVTCEGAFMVADFATRRFIIGDGNGGAVLGGSFQSVVDSVDSPTQITLHDAVPTAVTLGRCIIGQGYGTGFIQTGQNAHFTKFERCMAFYLRVGLSIIGGSAHFEYCNFDANELDIYIGSAISMPCSESFSNCETSRQHLRIDHGRPYTMSMCRFAFDQKLPNWGWIEFGSSTKFKMHDTHFDQYPRAGEAYFKFTGGAGIGAQLLLERNEYAGGSATDTQIFGGSPPLNTNGAIIQIMDDVADPAGDPAFPTIYRVHAPNDSVRMGNTNPMFSTNTNVPNPGTDIRNLDYIFGGDSNGNGPPLFASWRDGFGKLRKVGMRPDQQQKVTGVVLTPDLDLYNFCQIEVNGAAPTINSSLGGAVAQRFWVVVWNHSGGAIVTNWHGTYVFAATPWVEPANGKWKIIEFIRLSPGSGNFQYALSVSPDIAGNPA